MNINASITRSLEKENRAYHEASSCVDCKPGLSVRRGTWTTVEGLSKVESAGIPVFFDGENVLLLPMTHTLVTGSTGTGKSEVFFKNQLKLLCQLPEKLRPSFLVTDLKGDISEMQAEYLKKHGYRVLVFDMRNPYRSARYNFIQQIFDDYTEAIAIRGDIEKSNINESFRGKVYPSRRAAKDAAHCRYLTLLDGVERSLTELSHIIIPLDDPKDGMWINGARTMLKAIMYTMLRDSENEATGMTRELFTIANVCRAAYSTRDDCDELVAWLRQAEDILCVKNAIAANYKISAKVTRDGFISSLNTSIGDYTSSSISALTATSNEIDLREVATSRTPYAIFVITDDRQKATNSICMQLINNLLNELTTAADASPTHSLPRDFIILADEFANMPALPNLANKITTLRSRRIWMMMAIQSAQQLRMVYGQDTAAIIGDNCDLHVFIGCNNDETKEAFARSMGSRLGVKTSFNISNDNNVTIAKSTADVPVIRKSDLDALELGQFYIRARQSQNMRSEMIPFFRQSHEGEELLAPAAVRRFSPTANLYDIYATVRKLDLDY